MLKFLALGDSYTVGEGIDATDAWPSQLLKRFRYRDALMAPPEIIATTGWTSSELLSAMDHANLKPAYDLVSLAVGVNNQYRGEATAAYREEFGELLRRAIALAGDRPHRVFVLSIPDWSVTPYAAGREREAVAAEINAFNRINAALAYAAGVNYQNVTALSRKAAREPLLLAPDGLHYSALMYRFWVDELFPRVWRELFPGRNINIPLIYQDESEGGEDGPEAEAQPE